MSDTTDNNDSTDTTDEPSKAELHERVNRLESLIERMLPSRRGVLGGLAAVLGGTYLGSQTVESSTGSAGQIGTTSDRPDIFADTLDFNSAAGSGFDVTGEIDGETITPAQTGTSTNRTDVFADTVDTNNLTGVSTGGDRQGCRVFLSTGQDLGAGARTKIQFDSESYDSDNNFDQSSHNWTCPKGGLYMVNLQVSFLLGGTDERTIRIATGTSAFTNNEGVVNEQNSSNRGDRLSVFTINKYNSGDTIAAYCRNVDDNDTLASGSGSAATFMEVAFLGGL